jgi:hypothetical protein
MQPDLEDFVAFAPEINGILQIMWVVWHELLLAWKPQTGCLE